VLNVAAAKVTPLDVGEPVYATITANENKQNRQISFNLHFSGRHGESLSFSRGEQQARAPRLVLTNETGAVAYTNNFEFG
jgi:hypothetical protein